jgi:hypothetical protein
MLAIVRLIASIIAGAALAVAVIAGCAQPGYDASKLRHELRQAGVPAEKARCVTDRFEDTFDTNQLGSHSDPSPAERTTVDAILHTCGVNVRPPR